MVHGRGRNPESMDDLFFGVHDEMLYARKTEPVEGILIFVLRVYYIFLSLAALEPACNTDHSGSLVTVV